MEMPPPPPPADGQGFFLPIQQIQGLARLFVQYRPIIQLGARLAKQKIPKDLDDVLTAIAGGDEQAVQNLQHMAQGQQQAISPYDPYNIEQDELPPTRIGERALTQDLARRAHQLYYKAGLSYREIAEFFTKELGVPVSHTTIATYIWDINEDDEANRGTRLKTLATVIIVPVVVAFAGFLVGHFFFR